ncbi:MAG TPA: cation:proton antiporter [Bacteriovoracaceae bacterium]|nr:cation:proton antiporter [Bacteriovoracaceae bacterium]
MAHGFLRDVGLSIVSAGALGVGVYKLKLPLLLGYLLAGIVLGDKLGFGIITNPETISTLSEIGLILLMYILGMEIDLKKLMKAGKAVFINGVTQFIGCALLGLIFFKMLGFSMGKGDFTLLYLAIAGSLSSTLIVVKILSDRVELDTLTSRITLGILVLQDVWAIAFLATQPNLANFQVSVLLFSFGKAGILILVSALLAKYLLPPLFERIGKQVELTLVVAMGWCFTIAGIAGYLGLSLEMGALVAGVSIASFPYHVQIAVKISSLRDFFVTLFFVALGLQIPMPNQEILLLTGAIVLFTLTSRVLIVFPVLYFLKYGNRGSLVPGLNLSQVSEFSLVILALGVGHGHIPQYILSSFIIALVITALLSSLIMPRTHTIYRMLNPLLEKIHFKDKIDLQQENTADQHEKSPKIILLGFYREASSFLKEIEDRHTASALEEIMVVDFNPETINKLKQKKVKVHYGDISHEDTLHHLDLHNAHVIISTIPNSMLKGTSNLKLLKAMKVLVPTAKYIVTAETMEEAKELYREGAEFVSIPRIVTAEYLTDVLERIEAGNGSTIKEAASASLIKREEIIG